MELQIVTISRLFGGSGGQGSGRPAVSKVMLVRSRTWVEKETIHENAQTLLTNS